jgi:hypothetical protein
MLRIKALEGVRRGLLGRRLDGGQGEIITQSVIVQ